MSTRAAIMLKLFAIIFVAVCGIAAIMAITQGESILTPYEQAVNNTAPTMIEIPETMAVKAPYKLIVEKKTVFDIDEKAFLIAKTVPSQTQISIIWGSSDNSVLTITGDGLATAIAPGETEVMVMVIDPDNLDAPSETFTVTVLAPTTITTTIATEPPATETVSAAQQTQPISAQPAVSTAKSSTTAAQSTTQTTQKPVSSGAVPAGNKNLTIANTSNYLSKDYVPALVIIGDKVPVWHPDMKLTKETLDAFVNLYTDMQSQKVGIIKVSSAYRSYQKQGDNLNNKIKELMGKGYTEKDAYDKATKTIQPAGASEHQLGVSIDVSNTGSLTKAFGNTPQGTWLARNAHKYGFIIRYPENKISVTGIDYEPWHLRYVGIEHAAYIYENKLCLEEYVAL